MILSEGGYFRPSINLLVSLSTLRFALHPVQSMDESILGNCR